MGLFDWMEKRRAEREKEALDRVAEQEQQRILQLENEAREAAEQESRKEQLRIENQIKHENYVCRDTLKEIQSGVNLINKSTSIEDKIAFYGCVVGGLKSLIETYPHRKDWYDALQDFKQQTGSIFLNTMRENAEKTIEKANMARTKSAKINYALKCIASIDNFANMQDIIFDNSACALIRATLNNYIHKVELQELKTKAERYEFKEEWKKAVSAYKDVLFFLKKDEIPDEEQQELFEEFELKIKEIEEKIKK